MPISITAHTEQARAKLLSIQEALKNMDAVIEEIALIAMTDLIVTTKRAIGVRPDGKRWNIEKPEDKWIMIKAGVAKRLLSNESKVMKFLDEGTKDHGPVRARMLYIPLTRKAALGYRKGLNFGVDFILAKHVKGMEPKHIVSDVRERVQTNMRSRMEAHLRKAING